MLAIFDYNSSSVIFYEDSYIPKYVKDQKSLENFITEEGFNLDEIYYMTGENIKIIKYE